MSKSVRPAVYGGIARILHWVIAVLVIQLLIVGNTMVDLPLVSQDKFWLFQLHKSLGFTLLGLMALRIVWRLTHPAPGLPGGMGLLQRLAAHGTHFAFYALLVLMPLAGWAIVSTSPLPIPTLLWGVIPIPHLPFLDGMARPDRIALSHLLMTLHALGGKLMIALIVLHVAAALYHHFWVRDGLLARMIPGLRGPANSAVALAMLISCLVLVTPPAAAAGAPAWTLDPATSTLKFEASIGGQAVAGGITMFTAVIRFDPATPEATAISIDIDVASLATGTAQVDATLQAPEWFDIAKHPKASFRATAAKQLGEGSYELLGELTLKGVTKPVVLPFALALDGATAKVTGSVTLDRNQFGVGAGQAAAAVAPEVRVILDLTATRQ